VVGFGDQHVPTFILFLVPFVSIRAPPYSR